MARRIRERPLYRVGDALWLILGVIAFVGFIIKAAQFLWPF